MEDMTNHTIEHEHVIHSSHDGGLFALVILGVILGIFLIITGCEMIFRMSHDGGIGRIWHCNGPSPHNEEERSVQDAQAKPETRV